MGNICQLTELEEEAIISRTCKCSHLAMLTDLLVRTTGPVLEMGCGFLSTPALHELCRESQRQLVSMDEKEEWVKKFIYFVNHWHEFYLIENADWEGCQLIDQINWDVVLVDHAPGERRKFDIDRLADRAKFIVVHDTQEPSYEYEPVLRKFKYRYDCKKDKVWTTVVSQTVLLSFLNDKERRCVISYAGDGREDVQKSLVESLSLFNAGFCGDILPLNEGNSFGCPLYKDVPYRFKLWAFERAQLLGYDLVLWLDSGSWGIKRIDDAFGEIRSRGYVFQQSLDNVGGVVGLNLRNLSAQKFLWSWNACKDPGLFMDKVYEQGREFGFRKW